MRVPAGTREIHFSSLTLAELFRDLYLEERSGVLVVEREATEKRVYFERGMILFAESSVEDEDLGRRLVAEGKISPGALAEARRSVAEAKDLPQVLVNRGLVGKATLCHTVRFLVDRVVQSIFKWEGGTARFSESPLVQEIFEADILSTFETILRGIQGMVGFAPLAEALRHLPSRIRRREPAPVPLERLALSPAHGFILSRVDGTSTMGEVLAILPPGEEEIACRFLFGLLVMGVLELDPPLSSGPFRVSAVLRDHADQLALEKLQEEWIRDTYAALAEKTPYEILGVTPHASPAEIEAAYAEAKERFSRDRFTPRIRERYRAELSVIESRFVEAYLTLTQAPVSGAIGPQRAQVEATPAPTGAQDLLVRVEMDKTRTKILLEENARQAEAYYAKARKFMREGDYYNAIQYGKLALSYAPEEARYHFLVGECQRRNPEPRWQRMAEQSLLRAAELDPWNADYRIALGRLYKSRGWVLRARRQFEEALEIVPDHPVAREELRELRAH